MQLRQSPDEIFRSFAAKVKGKAETCAFRTSTKCKCGDNVIADYTTETVKDVLLAGIADLDIRREALSLRDIPKMSINDVISFVEDREMARNATPSHSLSALSSYKTEKKGTSAAVLPANASNVTNKTVPCPDCGKRFPQFKQRQSGSWNPKPFTKCLECWRSSRQKQQASKSVSALSTDNSDNVISADGVVKQISALQSIDPSIIISKCELKKSKKNDHPRVKINIATRDNRKCGTVMAVADSGAMSNLWGLREFLASGFTKDDLIPVKIDIKAANKINLNVLGYINANITGHSLNDNIISCHDKIYVSDSVQDFFLSFDTMLDLGILGRNFPTVGQFNEKQGISIQATLSTGSGNTGNNTDNTCQCPKRSSVPPRPDKLPFAPIKENNAKMKEWLLDTFKSSTFNTCPHTPLPAMIGPPIEMHIDESAKPKACHTAAPVALHWQDQVHKDLLRDEALGVIEKVPNALKRLLSHNKDGLREEFKPVEGGKQLRNRKIPSKIP